MKEINYATDYFDFPGDIDKDLLENEIRKKLLPKNIDILTNFGSWFKSRFPHAQYVIVFDKDQTLIKKKQGIYHLDKNIVDSTLQTFGILKPKFINVMFTIDNDTGTISDLLSNSRLVKSLDLIITLDNIDDINLAKLQNQLGIEGRLSDLEVYRMRKPVAEIFQGYNVVILDDNIGADGAWVNVQEGVHGIKAPTDLVAVELSKKIGDQLLLALLKQSPDDDYLQSLIS